MLVSTVLKDKGSAVYTARSGQSLEDVAKLLAEKRIGAVVVTNQFGEIDGILSERDIVRAMAVAGGAVINQPASDFMTKSVFTCSPDETVDDLMELMTSRRIRHVPVVDGRRLIGLISIGDVVKHKIAKAEMEFEAMRQYIAAN
ncbi:MAG: CBS domain-containing protein [Pseudomonadota bacterium]